MVRNLVIFGGSSHRALTETICNSLGVPPGEATLSKFSVGETRVEIKESVRNKDVYIIQSAGSGSCPGESGNNSVNDHLIELLITISACKTASAKKVTAILPLFPYSRQSDVPYNKAGAPLNKGPQPLNTSNNQATGYSFESVPQSPRIPNQEADSSPALQKQLAHRSQPPSNGNSNGTRTPSTSHSNAVEAPPLLPTAAQPFKPQRGYKQWVAQAGTLVADLLTCAGADHIITMDLHDPQYQGFFDIPVDNLYGQNLMRGYIKRSIPNYVEDAIIVSPDAGGAKRATAIADALGMGFALIHKERPRERTPPIAQASDEQERKNASMILVGSVAGKTAILIDDLADTSNTITRAAKLLRTHGAKQIIAVVTHGVLSGDAIERINASALDKVVVTNSVNQAEHERQCPKLEVMEVGRMFAEAIRRVHHGESISVLFQHD